MNSIQKKLFDATMNGKLDIVNILLTSGYVDAYTCSSYALLIAVKMRHEEIVDLLLQHGASPKHNNEIFRAAIISGNNAIICLLLEHGADPTISNNAYIIYSSGRGLYENTLTLLEHGVPPVTEALEIACYHGYTALVRLLLQYGADPIGNDYSTFIYAKSGGFDDILDILKDADEVMSYTVKGLLTV